MFGHEEETQLVRSGSVGLLLDLCVQSDRHPHV
jgi:hypothetical protein